MDYFASAKCEMISLSLLFLFRKMPSVISFPLSCLETVLIFFIELAVSTDKLNEIYERIKLFAKQENISINKMIIKLISIGMITYLKGGMNSENVNK